MNPRSEHSDTLMYAQGCIFHIQTLHAHTHIRDDSWSLSLTLTVPTPNLPTDTKGVPKGSVCLSVLPRLCLCLDVNMYMYGFCVCLTKKIYMHFCVFLNMAKKTLCVCMCVCAEGCVPVWFCVTESVWWGCGGVSAI